jgi:hypothetical protein
MTEYSNIRLRLEHVHTTAMLCPWAKAASSYENPTTTLRQKQELQVVIQDQAPRAFRSGCEHAA